MIWRSLMEAAQDEGGGLICLTCSDAFDGPKMPLRRVAKTHVFGCPSCGDLAIEPPEHTVQRLADRVAVLEAKVDALAGMADPHWIPFVPKDSPLQEGRLTGRPNPTFELPPPDKCDGCGGKLGRAHVVTFDREAGKGCQLCGPCYAMRRAP